MGFFVSLLPCIYSNVYLVTFTSVEIAYLSVQFRNFQLILNQKRISIQSLPFIWRTFSTFLSLILDFNVLFVFLCLFFDCQWEVSIDDGRMLFLFRLFSWFFFVFSSIFFFYSYFFLSFFFLFSSFILSFFLSLFLDFSLIFHIFFHIFFSFFYIFLVFSLSSLFFL